MTRADLSRPAAVAEAKRQGFTHILTLGGPVALDDWRPYAGEWEPSFTVTGSTLQEQHPKGTGYWLPAFTVNGTWLLLRTDAPDCGRCGQPIHKGDYAKRDGLSPVHGSCPIVG